MTVAAHWRPRRTGARAAQRAPSQPRVTRITSSRAQRRLESSARASPEYCQIRRCRRIAWTPLTHAKRRWIREDAKNFRPPFVNLSEMFSFRLTIHIGTLRKKQIAAPYCPAPAPISLMTHGGVNEGAENCAANLDVRVPAHGHKSKGRPRGVRSILRRGPFFPLPGILRIDIPGPGLKAIGAMLEDKAPIDPEDVDDPLQLPLRADEVHLARQVELAVELLPCFRILLIW